MNRRLMLLFVIFLEGYIVLSSEIIAIRVLVPFVGSDTATISIIISAVLMPLAFGYYYGGNYHQNKRRKSIRSKIVSNMLISLAVLTFSLSHMLLSVLFVALDVYVTQNNILQTAIYSAVFLVYPVFLLGQTVPLITNYFRGTELARITGTVLFFSTAGSFIGAIFSTLVLMAFFGVHIAVILTLSLILIIILILSKSFFSKSVFSAILMVSMAAIINTLGISGMNIINNNQYNTAIIFDVEDEENSKILSLNNSASSKINADRSKMFPYINYFNDNFVAPLQVDEKIYNILVLGAGGFTAGIDDTKNNYTFIDVDPDLKELAENHFLDGKLSPNKKFISKPARAFLRGNEQKFDLIFIDVYSNRRTIPAQLMTAEFLIQVKNSMAKEGVAVFNMVESTFMQSAISQKYNNTFRHVFPTLSRVPVSSSPLYPVRNGLSNVLYICYSPKEPSAEIYTDNLNSFFYDF